MAGVRVVSLASGSSGNALLIDAGHTRLLLDAGISARRIGRSLADHGVALGSLDGVLLTHEHSDHITGVDTLGRRYGLTFYLTAGTARAFPLVKRLSHRLIPRAATFSVGGATVTSVPVSHDATETCGYVVEVNGATIAVFTDLGCGEAHLHEPLRRADLIVLEANHDLDQLWNGHYPWFLKNRVASPTGHLCNLDCGQLLAESIADRRERTVWLAHLSQDNNHPMLALTTVSAQVAGRALALRVLPRHVCGPVWEASRPEREQPAQMERVV